MGRVTRFILRYGMLVALLLLCGLLSVFTLNEQHPTDIDAAEQLARRIKKRFPNQPHVLVVTRNFDEDLKFGHHLLEQLEAAGGRVRSVQGSPLDARRKLDELAAEAQPLHVIAGNSVTANWLVFADLAERNAIFANTVVMQPESYLWPDFLKTQNLLNVANQIAVIAILAVGMTFVIIAGGIDLSVGSLIALSSVIAATLIRDHGGATDAGAFHMVTFSLIGIIACGLVGAFSGLMVVLLDIPPFIVTLAMMLVASGLAFIIADGNSVPELPASYTWLGREADLGIIPNAVILMLLVYAVAHIFLTRTVAGRYIYAVGDNRLASWLSGVPVKRVLLFTYVCSGALAGLGGIVVASNYQSGDPRYGIMYELYVIAAVVVGGSSLSGGRGTVLGTLVGAFLIGVINNGMNLAHVNPYSQKVILGLVILGAVLLDQMKNSRWLVAGAK